jgi:hypothetical protein
MGLSSLFERFSHIFKAFLILMELTVIVKRWSILLAVAGLIRGLTCCKGRLVSVFFLNLQGAS